MGQRISRSALVFIALSRFLTSELPITAEESTLLNACCWFARDWWSIFSWDASPGYTQFFPPHTSYNDIVSFCGAAQSWVLQHCCLTCLWFEVTSSCVLRKEIMSQFKLILIGWILLLSCNNEALSNCTSKLNTQLLSVLSSFIHS